MIACVASADLAPAAQEAAPALSGEAPAVTASHHQCMPRFPKAGASRHRRKGKKVQQISKRVEVDNREEER